MRGYIGGMKEVWLPPEAIPIVSVLMEMWSDRGTPEEVLEMIMEGGDMDLDIEYIETPHGTLNLLKPLNTGD